MTTTFSRHLRSLVMNCCVLAIILGSAPPVRAQTGVVMVNGEPITEDDIEQRTRLNFLGTRKQSARQDVINELIDEEKKIKEAEKFGVGPNNADVDGAYAKMCSRMRITPEQLTRSLEGQGIRPDTLKQRIKADMARTSLLRLRYSRLPAVILPRDEERDRR